MSAGELFWDTVCAFRRLILAMILIDCIILGVMLIPLPYLLSGEFDSATTTISIVTYIMALTLLASLLYFYFRCERREPM